jgi:hypothetical protein
MKKGTMEKIKDAVTYLLYIERDRLGRELKEEKEKDRKEILRDDLQTVIFLINELDGGE